MIYTDMNSRICLPALRVAITLITILLPFYSFGQTDLKLWYKKPAKVWTEALPLGNGRLGAMVFGGTRHDLIQLNEATLWSGGPVKTNVNPGAYANLLLARKALLENQDYAKANEYTRKMQGYYSNSYLPLGDLIVDQAFKDTSVTGYYRDLNISNATATVSFTADSTNFTRQMISSAPDQVIILHYTSDRSGKLNLLISAKSLLRYQQKALSYNEITLVGRAPTHDAPSYVRSANPITYGDSTGCDGMRFTLRVKAISKDGLITTDTAGIKIQNATDVLVFISAATSFNGFDKCPFSEGRDENKLADDYLNKATPKSWAVLLQRHQADYHKFFNRVKFRLDAAKSDTVPELPADERLLKYTAGAKDPGLETLYFQYGRYLLISCSRPGNPPANLQGIWNNELRPPWSSNYTTNINFEMNYWPAESTNLSEMQEPMISFIKNAAVTGSVTAREFYHARGWVVHHNSDIWALSNPVGDKGFGDPVWANWTMGAAWLSQHLWWHYQYTKDQDYLKKTAYPLMKGAAHFYMDWLVPYKGYLVTAPSVSPENSFFDDNGKKGGVSIATTMDMSQIWELFSNVINASVLLNMDKPFRDSLIADKKLLYPMHIGKKGNLQEWYKDWDDPEPHHRHVSQLFGLFPGNEVSVIRTPLLAAAAKKSLELRGDESTGWSLAWKINLWAHLFDGNHAYKLIRDLLRLTGTSATNYSEGGGTYPNFFDAHPPFQIDGNFGGLSGMTEMLMQSQYGEIYLLPALPDEWSDGEISGLKARGNFEVAIKWKSGKITSASITSISGGVCKIRTNTPVACPAAAATAVKTSNGYLLSFNSRKGVKYNLTAINISNGNH
jgi:alpha-L-fucosidase 2